MLGTIARGVVAGAVGTLAMDLVWWRRSRAGGSDAAFLDWEVTREVASWDEAPAPAQVGRKLVQLTGRDVPLERAPALTNAMHWGYGTSWAALYALAVRRRPWWAGPALGATIWASDYVTLPLAGVYEPIWTYKASALWQDLSAHLVFGAVADASLRVLSRP